MAGLSGGCLCGAVRYELQSAPFDCGWCHCRTCQLNSGAPAMVFATVPEGDFVWTSGAEKSGRCRHRASATANSAGHAERRCWWRSITNPERSISAWRPSTTWSGGSRLSHLLAKQDRLVRAEGRAPAARQVPARYPGARRNRAARM